MGFLVGEIICMLPGHQGRFWYPLMGFLVMEAFHVFPGQQGGSQNPLVSFPVDRTTHMLLGHQGRFRHPPVDLLVAEAICTLKEQHGQVLGLAGGISSGWIGPRLSRSLGVGPSAHQQNYQWGKLSSPFQVGRAGIVTGWWNF